MKRLINIQQKLKSPKGNYNQHGKFAYRKASDILEEVKPLLAQESVSIILNDDVVEIGEKHFVKAVASLYDSNGAQIISTSAYAEIMPASGFMSAPQTTGAASSYARKYALCGLLAIDDSSNDPDTIENKPTTLEEGLAQIKNCRTVDELKEVWSENNHLHKEEVFQKEKNKRKEELTKKIVQQ